MIPKITGFLRTGFRIILGIKEQDQFSSEEIGMIYCFSILVFKLKSRDLITYLQRSDPF